MGFNGDICVPKEPRGTILFIQCIIDRYYKWLIEILNIYILKRMSLDKLISMNTALIKKIKKWKAKNVRLLGLFPCYISDLLVKYQQIHSLRYSGRCFLSDPKMQLKTLHLTSAPQSYGTSCVKKSSQQRPPWKSLLKTFFYQKAFPDFTWFLLTAFLSWQHCNWFCFICLFSYDLLFVFRIFVT